MMKISSVLIIVKIGNHNKFQIFKQYIPKQRYVQPCTMYEQQGYGILYINCNINAFFSFHLFIYQNVISR